MKTYYAASTGGFYNDKIHGPRQIEVPVIDPISKEATGTEWVPNPKCLIPVDAVEITAAEHKALLDDQSAGMRIEADPVTGRPVSVQPPPPTPEQLMAALQGAVQAHLDAAAQARGYDNILSACSYAGAANPFQAESVAFITWRGAVWTACYAMLADYQAGTIPMPTEAELIAALPAFTG